MEKKHWPLIAKALLIICAGLAYGFIYQKLDGFEHWDALVSSFTLSIKTVKLLALLVFLWFINLACETKKWQALMQPFSHINFKDAWRQVMAGTTTAVGSPARIAEMGGRMALLPKQQRMNAAVMTSLGGIIQSAVIFIGGITILLMVPKVGEQFKLPLNLIGVTIVSVVAVILIVLALRFVFPNKFKYYLSLLRKTNRRTILKSVTWTTLRYFTFIIQLYIWLDLWGLSTPFFAYVSLAAFYFFLITIIPSHILADMGIRGSVALIVFSTLFENSPLVLAAIFCLWSSNVIIPTIIGSFILIRQKLIKQRVIEKET